ncbi:MAG: 3-deoxy-D-manno-octulosonic acid kinase [Granulosicoccaceae bacterium]
MSKIDQVSDKNTTWCFLSDPTNSPATPLNKRLFDTEWLHQQGFVAGRPKAGRGNTLFLNIDGTELVLREYLRGGLVQHLNPRYYLWKGLQSTRAFRELDMLNNCIAKGLPVSIGYACKIERHGLFYTASLITHKLEGLTFADLLANCSISVNSANVPEQVWQSIGKAVARFHSEGIWHADLNAHNILVQSGVNGNEVSLIDFDRARTLLPKAPAMKSNIARLHRSLVKEAGKGGYSFDAGGWANLLQGYEL